MFLECDLDQVKEITTPYANYTYANYAHYANYRIDNDNLNYWILR